MIDLKQIIEQAAKDSGVQLKPAQLPTIVKVRGTSEREAASELSALLHMRLSQLPAGSTISCDIEPVMTMSDGFYHVMCALRIGEAK